MASLLTVGQSANSTLTVRTTRPAGTRSVLTLVQVSVVAMQTVGSGTTSPCVSVTLASLETHSLAATDQQVSFLLTYQISCFHMNLFVATSRPVEVIQPCNPSPCGRNADCTELRGAASCRCIRDYIGNPYIECKPECVVNAECPRDKACLNQHCRDPCPGVCGAHATCSVANHAPQCRCDPGYEGDAFVACRRITTRKLLIL